MTTIEATTTGDLRYWVSVLLGAVRSMLDISMLVAGCGLVGLAVAVFLDGFGLVEIGLGLSTAGMLGSALVIGVVGAFAFGVSSEGRFGLSGRTEPRTDEHRALARAVAAALIGLGWWLAARRLADFTDQINYPIEVAIRSLGWVGISGMLAVPVIGAGGSYLLSRSLARAGFGRDVELGLIFVVWLLGALASVRIP